MATYKRRRYFIDKQLQTKYLVMTLLLLVVYTLLFAAVLFVPHILSLSSGETLAEQTSAARTLLTLHTSVWPALGVVILVMSTLSIFITHKIAGPVYRFKKVLAEISGGNLDISVKLRAGDDLKDLAEEFNVVIGELRTFVNALRADDAAIAACIGDLEEQVREGRITVETAGELIDKLQTSRESIARALGKYNL